MQFMIKKIHMVNGMGQSLIIDLLLGSLSFYYFAEMRLEKVLSSFLS